MDTTTIVRNNLVPKLDLSRLSPTPVKKPSKLVDYHYYESTCAGTSQIKKAPKKMPHLNPQLCCVKSPQKSYSFYPNRHLNAKLIKS